MRLGDRASARTIRRRGRDRELSRSREHVRPAMALLPTDTPIRTNATKGPQACRRRRSDQCSAWAVTSGARRAVGGGAARAQHLRTSEDLERLRRQGRGNASSSLSMSDSSRRRSSEARFWRTWATVPPRESRRLRPGREPRRAPPRRTYAVAAGDASHHGCSSNRPARGGSRPSPGHRGHGTTAARSAQCRVARGCRRPGRSAQHHRPGAQKPAHIDDVEVAHPPVADQSRRVQPLEAGDGLLKRNRAPPVEEVEVEPFGADPAQTPRHAAIVPSSVACDGSTLLTRKMSSRRPAIASPTSSSARPSPYISAVSMSVIPRSTPSRSARISSARG